ncbi:hypothetical protein EVAR_67246_1 [Eumeta japonica]|uniref:Uncharacterized protein n=1 Tax=Eumeta variegata TaxID=151549 RepID=A0A4C1YUB2_EUMVA|nr:hypothetical protein EVAR_67246_1 [Eumeta japonica]
MYQSLAVNNEDSAVQSLYAGGVTCCGTCNITAFRFCARSRGSGGRGPLGGGARRLCNAPLPHYLRAMCERLQTK